MYVKHALHNAKLVKFLPNVVSTLMVVTVVFIFLMILKVALQLVQMDITPISLQVFVNFALVVVLLVMDLQILNAILVGLIPTIPQILVIKK